MVTGKLEGDYLDSEEIKFYPEEKVEYYKSQCPGSQICLAALFENTIM
ncbi:unnamed protein product, partial [marine sediment metagenome]